MNQIQKLVSPIILVLLPALAILSVQTGQQEQESEASKSLKERIEVLERAKDAHEQKLKKLSGDHEQLDKQLTRLLDSQPRSFISEKVLDKIGCGPTAKELDSIEVETNGRPIAFFLAPADDPNTPSATSILGAYLSNPRDGGGAATYIKLFRTHDDKRKLVASQFMVLHITYTKAWDGARFVGIDAAPPKGKAIYSLEINSNANTTTVHNLRFIAFELPFASQ